MTFPKFRPRLIPLMILCGILSGCVTQKRCHEKFPPGTITTIRDTVVITGQGKTDTIVEVAPGDTVLIHDTIENIRLKVIRLPGDSIFIEGDCPPDTVRVPIEINTAHGTPAPPPNFWERYWPLWWLIAACVLFLSFGYMIKAIRK